MKVYSGCTWREIIRKQHDLFIVCDLYKYEHISWDDESELRPGEEGRGVPSLWIESRIFSHVVHPGPDQPGTHIIAMLLKWLT